jgi:putative ABC transport system permease protein
MTGLAIGLSCFLLIALYVLDELSYDKQFANADRVYRTNADVRFGGTDLHLPLGSDMLGSTLKKDYPQIEQYARVYTSDGAKLVKKGSEFINEDNVANVDSTFFEIFPFPAIGGNLSTALNEPNSVVISEKMAKKYFGTVDVVGKTLETNDNNSTLYKVNAVIKDIPSNSHLNFDFFFSMDNVQYNWGSHLSFNFHTYLLFKQKIDPASFDRNFKEYTVKYVFPQAKQIMDIKSMDDFEKAGNSLVFSLTPLTKIHLYSDRQFEIRAGQGNIQYVYIFSVIAIVILLIACINFMNLTTARSANRAREVGIRKVLGTEKKNLISQFLTESTLMAIVSLLFAILIAWLALPLFNDISSKTMSFPSLFKPTILPVLIALPFVVGLLAGSYPAFFLSAFRPIEVLKGKLKTGSRSGGLRSGLVVVQFFFSIVLIIGTIVIYKQLNFIQTKNLGFKKDQVLIINNAYALNHNADPFMNEVLKIQGVQSGTFSGYLPVPSSRSDNTWSKETVFNEKTGFNMQNWNIDYDYIQTLGMEIVKGRNFSRAFGTDSNAIIINEATAALLGYPEPVGHKVYTIKDFNDNTMVPYTIIGVVKNFHYESLKKEIGPLSFLLKRSTGLASFKVSTDNIKTLVGQIERKWKAMAPSLPFSYQFLDESFDQMYREEQRVGKIAFTFALLAIFIACLGLFGLAAFIAEARVKEIGIRKVLGANVSNIVNMLSKDFAKLVLISAVFAFPVAWWVMNYWLKDFAFRVNIGWWVFALAGVIALIIALFTVSFQAIKAALANPVKSLRSE